MHTLTLFDLNDSWAVQRDSLQFILSKTERRVGGITRYKPMAFTRWGREGVLREIAKRGIEPTPKALDNIRDLLPSEVECLKEEIALIRSLTDGYAEVTPA
jgi:hypothetical protein